MHLTVRKYRKVEGDRKQFIESVGRSFVPLVSKIDGFIDYYIFFADDGALLSVSVFRDANGTEQSARAAARWLEQNMPTSVTDKPEVMSGEVFAHAGVEKQKAA